MKLISFEKGSGEIFTSLAKKGEKVGEGQWMSMIALPTKEDPLAKYNYSINEMEYKEYTANFVGGCIFI